jgi:ABC-type bacteriocin/lantibiotic exporter with double-glycine peptidase domain
MLLLGLIEPETGEVTVDGDRIGKYCRQTLWKHIGYVPQEPILFRGSARENIAVGRSIAETDIITTNMKIGTHGRLAAAGEGYDSDLGESGFRLSGGERQRVSLARALAGCPSVLVLDEPTANLDAATETLIRNVLVDQRDAGRTVIIVTHNPAILAIADRVVLLKQGHLVCSGSIHVPPFKLDCLKRRGLRSVDPSQRQAQFSNESRPDSIGRIGIISRIMRDFFPKHRARPAADLVSDRDLFPTIR